MNTDDFDPLDDETLARGLNALAPSEFDLDADAALGTMRPALHRARFRRRLAMSSSALGVVVALAAGAAVLRQQPTSHVDIRSRTRPTVETPTTTKSTKPTTSTSTSQPRVVPPPTAPQQFATTTAPTTDNGGTVPRSTPTAPTTTPTTHDGHGGSTPTTVAAPVTKTYSSTGGKVTIRFANGRLTLVSHSASPGYTTEVHTNKPDDIELRFSNGTAESRIRIQVDNGQLRPEITEN